MTSEERARLIARLRTITDNTDLYSKEAVEDATQWLSDLKRLDAMEKALRYYADVEGDENAMGGNLDGMGRYIHHKSKGIQAWDELDQGRTAKQALGELK